MNCDEMLIRQVIRTRVGHGLSRRDYRLLHAWYLRLSRGFERGEPTSSNKGVSGLGRNRKSVMFDLALERLFAMFLEFAQVSKSSYRYLLTRLENNEPTIASLEQTIEDIKAVLAASNVPIPEGLAELHQSGTFKIVNNVPAGKIETILMARPERVSAIDAIRDNAAL